MTSKAPRSPDGKLATAAENRAELARDELWARYVSLRSYVGAQADDGQRIRQAAPVVLPHLSQLIDDFYEEIQRHAETSKRITGGQEQIERLKGTLSNWLRELLAGDYGPEYIAKRWLVGWRHVEIGLRQMYVNVALGRLRGGILNIVQDNFDGDEDERFAAQCAINRALDLDLAIVQDAYESEKHVRSEAAFRSLVEAADCAIFILRADLKIAYLNSFAEAMTGYALADIEGSNFSELLIQSSQRQSIGAAFEQVARGEPTLGKNVTVLCRDGSQRQLVWNVRQLDDFAGEAGLLGVGHDITALQQAQERAVQAERLAAIGQTMAGLAHESRNAFQRIQACLEMLQLEVEDRPEALELVQRIQRAQNHLHQLNEEVRSYAAPIRLETQRCDLPALWREAWQDLEINRHGKDVKLLEAAEVSNGDCEVDHFALGQVFRNVLENAISACPREHGRIEINMGAAKLSRGRPAVAISIQDNGPGLQQEAQERIFEPFYTTKTKGTGLGMAIAKRIIDAHGGKISAKSASGRGGAQITVTLPRAR